LFFYKIKLGKSNVLADSGRNTTNVLIEADAALGSYRVGRAISDANGGYITEIRE
jgi:hypothetical protein